VDDYGLLPGVQYCGDLRFGKKIEIWQYATGVKKGSCLELEIGFLVEKGLYRTEDAPLLYRALAAVHVYQVGQVFAQDRIRAVEMDSELVTTINNRISPLVKRRKALQRRARRSKHERTGTP
jgi:hypothetical protein